MLLDRKEINSRTQLANLTLQVIRFRRSGHRAEEHCGYEYRAFHPIPFLIGLTIPLPSRIVRIWFAFTPLKLSTLPVVGHLTSIISTVGALPIPKCKRKSLCDMTLDPLCTSSICVCFPTVRRTRAPMAVRLHLVPISLILIQFCLFPPSLRNREGRSFMFRTRTSMSPSLS